LENWNSGIVELQVGPKDWKIGKWKTGMMENWNNGNVEIGNVENRNEMELQASRTSGDNYGSQIANKTNLAALAATPMASILDGRY
jgi:hypothetical protein